MNDIPIDPTEDKNEVIYTLRTAHQSQTQLNLMADQKANILVGTIVIVLTFLFTRLPQHYLADQTSVLLIVIFTLLEVIAVLLGIMVIKPRTRWLNLDVKIEDMPNPLFFGFFTRFKEQEYVDHMQQVLTHNLTARELLLKDLYQIGLVLKRKFTLLKFAYNFAAMGVLFAIIAFSLQLYS